MKRTGMGRIARYVYASLLAVLLAGTSHAGTVTYIYTDPQGTPLAEADASGAITATLDYKPYGSQALGTAKDGPGYTGHVNDADTGFVYMQARYYDPAVGRFISKDPAGIVLGSKFAINIFSYAGNNPYNNIDPSGMVCGGNGEVSSSVQSMRDTSDGCDSARSEHASANATVTSGLNAIAPDAYQSLLGYGGIDLSKNAEEASKMSHLEWVEAVRPGGRWDYKNTATMAGFSNKKILAEFGNWHYGFTAAANGIPFVVAVAGAGEAQVILQRHQASNTFRLGVTELAVTAAPYLLLSRSAVTYMAEHGLNWGDNEDDSKPIIDGYEFYENNSK